MSKLQAYIYPKKRKMKVLIPDEWNLKDHTLLRDYYEAIERTFEDYRILGFITSGGKTNVLLEEH